MHNMMIFQESEPICNIAQNNQLTQYRKRSLIPLDIGMKIGTIMQKIHQQQINKCTILVSFVVLYHIGRFG